MKEKVIVNMFYYVIYIVIIWIDVIMLFLLLLFLGGKDWFLDKKKKFGMELNLYIEVIVYIVIISNMFLLLWYIFYVWWLCKLMFKVINWDNYF